MSLIGEDLSFPQDTTYSNIVPGWILKEYAHDLKLTPTMPMWIRDIHMVDDSVGYVVGNNGQIAKTINGGTKWELLNSGTSLHLYSVSFVNENIGFVAGQAMDCLDEDCNKGSILLKTTNGGKTWSKIFFEDYTGIFCLKFFDELNGLAIIHTPIIPNSGDCYIARTSDGGKNWELLELAVKPAYDEFYCVDNIVFIAGENQKIYKSIDFGNNWELINTPVAAWNDIRNMYFYNENIGFVDGISNIYKTSDGGLNWEIADFPFESIRDLHFFNDTIVFNIDRVYTYEGGEYPVFKGSFFWSTIDGGLTWNESALIPNLSLVNVKFLNDIKGYACNSLYYYSLEKNDPGDYENCWYYEEVDSNMCMADSMFIGDQWQTEEGIYFDILTSHKGCDSIVEITLSYYTIAQGFKDISICESDSILIGNRWEKEDGIYFDTLTCQHGCDSIIMINLTLYSCGTNSFSYTDQLVQLYPNPVENFIVMELSRSSKYSICLYSSSGMLLKSFIVNESTVLNIDLSDYVTGLYLLNVYNNNENQIFKIYKK